MFLEISQNSQENTFVRDSSLIKSLWHRCFPVKFARFLRTPFFTEHLQTTASVIYPQNHCHSHYQNVRHKILYKWVLFYSEEAQMHMEKRVFFCSSTCTVYIWWKTLGHPLNVSSPKQYSEFESNWLLVGMRILLLFGDPQ